MLRELLRKTMGRFHGLRYSQEYLCLAREDLNQQLRVFLVVNGRVREEVTGSHIFAGYAPLVIGIAAGKEKRIRLVFSNRDMREGGYANKGVEAFLELEMIAGRAGDSGVDFYRGIAGDHAFLPRFNQWMISLSNHWFNRKPGNIFLDSALYRQVQIAYSIPRTISLVTVSDGRHFNLFPTDLHGAAGDSHYIISLRHAGMACRQVMDSGRISLSAVSPEFYRDAYALGKNHMRPMKEKEDFPFGHHESRKFQLPLPLQVQSYREMEYEDSFLEGIHRIICWKIRHHEKYIYPPGTLAHVHNSYATWRWRKGLKSNYLIR